MSSSSHESVSSVSAGNSSYMRRFLVVIAVSALAIGIIGILVAREVRKASILATHSAAASLRAALEDSAGAVTLANDWHVFSRAEYDRVARALADAGVSLDACPTCYTQTGVIGDAWGNRFQIAGRKRNDGHRDVIVWSNGPDGVSGTEDDMVVPEYQSAAVRMILEASEE